MNKNHRFNRISLKWCCDKQINPLYTDINENDYTEPLKRLSNENKYLEKYIPKNKNELNDTVIQFYIKSMKNISILCVYPNSVTMNDQYEILIKRLKEFGTIHYTKDISINYYTAYNLIYQLYANEERMKSNAHILYKINRLGFKKDSVNKMQVIVYSLSEKSKKENINISGSSAAFKMELRDIFVNEAIKNTKFTEDDDRYPRGYDFLHISDNSNQSYEYASLLFHENSMNFLEKQKSWRLLEMSKAQENFNKLKDFIYSYSMMELEKLLLNSSVTLYTHGIREANDIDGLLLENDKIKSDDIKKINSNEILDISYRPNFDDTWLNELNRRAKLLGAENYQELVMNPKYYYYFMGIKIMRLKYEIIIRSQRRRPAQLTDLLIIRQMFKLNYQLSIPDETLVYDDLNKKDVIEKVNKQKYLQTVQFYIKTRYEINLTLEQIEEWIKMTYEKNNDKYFDSKYDGGSSESNVSNQKIDNKYIEILKNQSNDDIIYPEMNELIKMGYSPNITIYGSDKPYLYEGENFYGKNCRIDKETIILKKKNKSLRILSFNVHNFISRCNQGISPIFETALNPFENPRDINKFISFFKDINADVLCLQELVPIYNEFIKNDITDFEFIRNNFNFKYFNSLMEEIGYKYNVLSSTQRGNFLKSEINDYYYLANGIYSKYEIKDSKIYEFSFLNRNVVQANISWNNKIVKVFNTQWEYFNEPSTKTKENPLELQSKIFFEIINNNLFNTILCGDFNINLYKKGFGPRYFKWEERTKLLQNNFINTSKNSFPTNFSQLEQTDFILISKKNNLRPIYSIIVKTNISDHYAVLTDFI